MALRADLVIEIEEAPAIAETDALLPTTGECTEFKKKNTTQNNSEETLLEGHQGTAQLNPRPTASTAIQTAEFPDALPFTPHNTPALTITARNRV